MGKESITAVQAMKAGPKSRKSGALGRPVGERATGSDLLDAAGALMAEKDTLHVSLAEIARRAGLTPAVVKYYFGGKEGLYVALVLRDAEAALNRVRALNDLDIQPVEKLKRHIAGAIHYSFRVPYFNQLLHLLLRDSSSKNAKKIVNSFIRPLLELQTQYIREAQEAGQIKDLDPMLFYFASAGATSHLFNGSSILKNAFGIVRISDELHQRYMEQTVDILLGGALTAEGRDVLGQPAEERSRNAVSSGRGRGPRQPAAVSS